MRDWQFRIGEWVVINEKAKTGLPSDVGKVGIVFELITNGNYDYMVDCNHQLIKVKENELNKINDDTVDLLLHHNNNGQFIYANENVLVTVFDLLNNQAEIMYEDKTFQVIDLDKLKVKEVGIMVENNIGKFEKIATELGQFTDKKNKQYGSSVDATYEMIKVLMDRYKNEDDTYTIPQSLLQHILLQVRMMDKINRIFNNPSGKGDSESPYRDLTGYSLIGVEMVESK